MTDTELVARLEKLERDNRRLKRFGGAALVLVAAMGLMAATRPIPDVIKAHKFEAVDGEGVARVVIKAESPSGASIGLGEYSSYAGAKSYAGIAIVSAPSGPSIHLLRVVHGEAASIGLLGLQVSSRGEPDISLRDAKGFDMELGSTGTQSVATGATQQTSADSIIMFGNDKKHHVIWKAP